MTGKLTDPWNVRAAAEPVINEFCNVCGHDVQIVYRPDLSKMFMPERRGTCIGCGTVHEMSGG